MGVRLTGHRGVDRLCILELSFDANKTVTVASDLTCYFLAKDHPVNSFPGAQDHCSPLVILQNRFVQQLVFVIFLVICLMEPVVSQAGEPLAYRSSALGFDRPSEAIAKTPNS